MTRERAIQIISNYDLNFHEVNEKLFDYGEVAEAFDMAIKALEGADLDGYSSRLWKAAYERGKADAEAEQVSTLDKIKEEIERTKKIYLDMNDIDWLNGCDYVLAVIDKYRAESEEKA